MRRAGGWRENLSGMRAKCCTGIVGATTNARALRVSRLLRLQREHAKNSRLWILSITGTILYSLLYLSRE
jgi:hypothetical protein